MAEKARRGDQMEETLTAEAEGASVAEQPKRQVARENKGITIQRYLPSRTLTRSRRLNGKAEGRDIGRKWRGRL